MSTWPEVSRENSELRDRVSNLEQALAETRADLAAVEELLERAIAISIVALHGWAVSMGVRV